MEPRFLTVAEAARYLRLNPRSVYLLAQRADSGEPGDRKWLCPRPSPGRVDRVERARSDGASDVAAAAQRGSLPPGSLLLAGSDDPGLELLADALRDQPGQPLLFSATLGRGGGLLAAPRGPGGSSPRMPTRRLPPASSTSATSPGLFRAGPWSWSTCFGRELGLVVWTGNPRKLEGVRDLARRGVRFVNRQPGSATRAFTEAALAEARIEAQRRRRVPRRGVDPLGG